MPMRSVVLSAFLSLALNLGATAEGGPAALVHGWRGDDLIAWTSHVTMCRDVRMDGDVLKGVVTGVDAQLSAGLPEPLPPEPNHVVYVRLRAKLGGRAQLFWISEGQSRATEDQSVRFNLRDDGAWHTYRVRPRWNGAPIRTLRLDLPETFANEVTFELGGVVIRREGNLLDINADDTLGVVFTWRDEPGQQYRALTWTGDHAGEFMFTPATDGCSHTYYFCLRGEKNWQGRVRMFSVENIRRNRELPVSDLHFVTSLPSLPPDPVILHAASGEAVPRAGRVFPLEVALRNFGTAPAPISLEVRRGEKSLRRLSITVEGSLGRENNGLGKGSRAQLEQDLLQTILLPDLGVGETELAVILSQNGVERQRVTVPVRVLPSLGLAKVAYPPEPKPVSTAPYEIGAVLFPGWTVHQWHAVWSHALIRKPVLGWYDEANPETIDWQIKQLVENGISFVQVDWYWCAGRRSLNHWMEKSFPQAKYRKYLKWSLMWANHNAPGTHSAQDMEAVTRYWVEHYFRDPQYQLIDGKPVVGIFCPLNMERDMAGKGGAKALLDIATRVAREAGFPGLYFLAYRGPDREDAAFLKQFADLGFDCTCVYRYLGSGVASVTPDDEGNRAYADLAATSLAHWRRLRANGAIPFWPSLTTGWDNRPWLGERGWAVIGANTNDFRRICREARRYADESKNHILLMGPLDEWGEGEIGYPNAELGWGMLEAVRDTFGTKPTAGWPINAAPQDFGLVCPQRTTY